MQDIINRLEKSTIIGLIPHTFEIVGDEIEFHPTERFWRAWRMNRNLMEGVGVRVYSIASYRRSTKADWRARVLIEILDTPEDPIESSLHYFGKASPFHR